MTTEEKAPEAGAWKRSNYIPAPHYYELNAACTVINRSFDGAGGFGCYLVGSALVRRDYRDVDVRYIMNDEQYMRLFRNESGWLNPLWTLMVGSISLWLSKHSGLPVDFQIQMQTRANAEHKGARHPLGIFLDYPGELPDPSKPHVLR